MREGWIGDAYMILFERTETSEASKGYGISDSLPGYEVIGLRGWDDLIVRDTEGYMFTVPTVPLDAKHLSPFQMPNEQLQLQADERLLGRIKWYVKPVVFGGDPSPGKNLVWVDHIEHARLVRYWNNQYRSIAATSS